MTAVMNSPTPYQLMPRLSSDEYEALRDDIAAHGVRVPIDVDEDGVVLDGHHRAWITAELGIDCPRRIVSGLDDEQKRRHAIAVNVHRRNLTREQRRDLIVRLRGEGMTQQQIAQSTGIHQSQVSRQLADVMQTHNAGLPTTITDTQGRKQPAAKPRPAPALAPVEVPGEVEVEELPEGFEDQLTAQIERDVNRAAAEAEGQAWREETARTTPGDVKAEMAELERRYGAVHEVVEACNRLIAICRRVSPERIADEAPHNVRGDLSVVDEAAGLLARMQEAMNR